MAQLASNPFFAAILHPNKNRFLRIARMFFTSEEISHSQSKKTRYTSAMLYSPFINELKEKVEFEGPFLAKQILLHQDKNGKPYLLLILQDKSGEAESRVWDNAEKIFDAVKPQDIVRVAGRVNLFQGRRQLILQAVEKAAPGAYPLDRFLPASRYSIEQMHHDLLTLMRSMESPFAIQLAEALLLDKEFQPLILRAPAAKSIHHAYAGGLVEHVLSVCRILDNLAKHYQNYYGKQSISRDLLLLGGLLHDIGKIFELRFDRATEYSFEGQLIGHLVQGCELVDQLTAKISDFPAEFRTLIKHQILAHHGKLEYGSPKLPHTVEAMLVHYVDDLDSKVNHIFGLLEKDEGNGRFSQNLKLFERPFLKPAVKPQIQGSSPGIA